MIEKFKSAEAGEFWVNSFSNKDQVSRKDFISKFKERYEKLQLKKSDVDKIIEKIDEDKDLLIRYDEWDKFCVSIWSNKQETQKFLSSFNPKNELNNEKLGILVLRYIQANPDDEGYNDFKIKNGIEISETEYIVYQDKNQPIINKKTISEEALVIGRRKKNMIDADICFNEKTTSVSARQFQINVKRLKNTTGYFLNNLSTVNRTCLKLEEVPIIIENLMIFNLNSNFVEILDVSPKPSYKFLLEQAEKYHFLDFEKQWLQDEEYNENKEQTMTRAKKKKSTKISKPTLTLVLSENDLFNSKESKTFTLEVEDPGVDQQFFIGCNEKADIFYEDLGNKQVIFQYIASYKSWIAMKGDSKEISSLLFLIHGNEIIGGKGNQGRLAVKLRKGMTIEFNENEFLVDFI